MAERYEAVTLHLHPDQVEFLQRKAEALDRSMSWVARHGLDRGGVRGASRSAPKRVGDKETT